MEILRRYFDQSQPISGSPEECFRELRRRVRSVISGPVIFAGLAIYMNRDGSTFHIMPLDVGMLSAASLALVVAWVLWRLRVAPLIEGPNLPSDKTADERAAELANRIFNVWLVVLGSSLVSITAYFSTRALFGLILGLSALVFGAVVAWPRENWFGSFHPGFRSADS